MDVNLLVALGPRAVAIAHRERRPGSPPLLPWYCSGSRPPLPTCTTASPATPASPARRRSGRRTLADDRRSMHITPTIITDQLPSWTAKGTSRHWGRSYFRARTHPRRLRRQLPSTRGASYRRLTRTGEQMRPPATRRPTPWDHGPYTIGPASGLIVLDPVTAAEGERSPLRPCPGHLGRHWRPVHTRRQRRTAPHGGTFRDGSNTLWRGHAER